MRNIFVILLAGGKGTRFGTPEPKQFQKLNNKPLVGYSLETFRNWGLVKSITLVSHPEWILAMEQIAAPWLEPQDRIVEGGETRHGSVLKGLENLPFDSGDLVLFHDAARPFFTEGDLESLTNAALTHGASSLVGAVAETVVQAGQGIVEKILPRESIYLVKTPQAIRGDWLLTLLQESASPNQESPTDLCHWLSLFGKKAALVETHHPNVKITRPEDLPLAEAWQKQKSSNDS